MGYSNYINAKVIKSMSRLNSIFKANHSSINDLFNIAVDGSHFNISNNGVIFYSGTLEFSYELAAFINGLCSGLVVLRPSAVVKILNSDAHYQIISVSVSFTKPTNVSVVYLARNLSGEQENISFSSNLVTKIIDLKY